MAILLSSRFAIGSGDWAYTDSGMLEYGKGLGRPDIPDLFFNVAGTSAKCHMGRIEILVVRLMVDGLCYKVGRAL